MRMLWAPPAPQQCCKWVQVGARVEADFVSKVADSGCQPDTFPKHTQGLHRT